MPSFAIYLLVCRLAGIDDIYMFKLEPKCGLNMCWDYFNGIALIFHLCLFFSSCLIDMFASVEVMLYVSLNDWE